MSAIRVLPTEVVDQIAAGEVVERPASVLKELLENALDAGATQIVTDFEGAGIERIRIWDNGRGIDEQDLGAAIMRHATSKIASVNDLWALDSYGFRGEALASIASVSKLTLTSRTQDADDAYAITSDGEIFKSAGNIGTSVEVRDLFYNVPARRKFLKSSSTETAQLIDVWMRMAMSAHGVQMTLNVDGKLRRQLVSAPTKQARVQELFAKVSRVGLKPILSDACEGMQLEAYLGAPEEARSAPSHLHLFINGRHIRDRALTRALAQAYGSVMPPGRYPLGVVFLTVPAAEVDVNVHPQKAEVRFANASKVFEFVMKQAAHGLAMRTWSTGASTVEEVRQVEAPILTDVAALMSISHESALELIPKTYDKAGPMPWSSLVDTPRTENTYRFIRALGQVRKLFIVVEGEGQLYVLDQHAADERIKYHRLRADFDARAVVKQMLMMPIHVSCSATEADACERFHDELDKLGFDCDRAASDQITVRSMPALLGKASPERLIRDALSELTLSGSKNLSDAIDMTLATMACHSAIRAGDALSLEECNALIQTLNSIDMFRGHCPHGRPVLYEIGYGELERKLGR